MKNYNQTAKLLEKKKIGVIGIGPSCGVSTIAEELAFYLAKHQYRVSYCEIAKRSNKSASYYRNSFDKNYEHQDLVDFYYQVKEGKPIHRLHNFWEGINWAITVPNSKCMEELNLVEKQRLINNLIGEYVVCDMEYDYSLEYSKLLEDFDLIIAIMDPLPSKIMVNFRIIQSIKEIEFRQGKVIWVINYYNKGVHEKDLVRSLKLSLYEKIPLIPKERIYDSEYRCIQLPLKGAEKAGFESVFNRILSEINS